jgi:hypothetical protein
MSNIVSKEYQIVSRAGIMKAPMKLCYNFARRRHRIGEVPEWLNGTVSKTVVGSGPPRVRIPPSPLKKEC